MLTLEEPPTLVCPQLSASPVLLTGTPPDLTVELPFAVLTFVCVFTPSTGRWSCTEEPSVESSFPFFQKSDTVNIRHPYIKQN